MHASTGTDLEGRWQIPAVRLAALAPEREEDAAFLAADDPHHGMVTLLDLVRFGASAMERAGLHYGHGTSDALSEAAFIVLRTLGLPLDLGLGYWQARVTDGERRAVLERLLTRIRRRCPAPYLVNEAWFAGLEFYVDRRVLVPRSPLAELIAQGFAGWLTDPRLIVDFGTGSGSLAIACCDAFPEARVIAIDADSDALAVAALNLSRHGLDERVTLVQADSLAAAIAAQDNGAVDLIVANPPYVPPSIYAALPPEYGWEPRGALEADDDGLGVVLRLLAESRGLLAGDGLLALEVGVAADRLRARLPTLQAYWPELEHGGEGVAMIERQALEF